MKPSEPPVAVDSTSDQDMMKRLAAVLQPPLESILGSDSVLEWPSELLPFQRDGVKALLNSQSLLLADDMGLGKTIQTIAALRVLFVRREIANALIVCPASLLTQWRKELALWSPELRSVTLGGPVSDRAALWRLPSHVKIVSYETLRSEMQVTESVPFRQAWDVVVLDEASRIKNRDTGIAVACKRLQRDRRWALTGTPLENRVDDVASILEFLVWESGETRPVIYPQQAIAMLPSHQLRRKKADVLKDLPPKLTSELSIDLLPRQREAYERAERQGLIRLKEQGSEITVTHILELISRLKQICNCDPTTGESSKLLDIQERLQTLVEEGHRALLFTQFTDDAFGVELVRKRLAKYSPLAYTGAMSQSQKAAAVEAFTLDTAHKVLVLSLRAGGVGLNLQTASYVFHLDRWWNPAIEDQADSRSHRIGQACPVTVYRYICTDTIEERIQQRLQQKRQLFRDIVDDVSVDLSVMLNEEDLFGLFGLAPPRSAVTDIQRDAANFTAMTGEQFEQWLAERLTAMGFTVQSTPRSNDGGIDLTAVRLDDLQIEAKLIIQCKNTTSPVGVSVVRELRGVVPDRVPGTTPVVAAPGGFSSEATAFARANGVKLWGPKELVELAGSGTPVG
ncbi:MAG: restriction endonuclease [Armatimonadetes bacterium]|nr:restriction endonuclease [Armatimonadota bacterium]